MKTLQFVAIISLVTLILMPLFGIANDSESSEHAYEPTAAQYSHYSNRQMWDDDVIQKDKLTLMEGTGDDVEEIELPGWMLTVLKNWKIITTLLAFLFGGSWAAVLAAFTRGRKVIRGIAHALGETQDVFEVAGDPDLSPIEVVKGSAREFGEMTKSWQRAVTLFTSPSPSDTDKAIGIMEGAAKTAKSKVANLKAKQ